MSWPPMPPTGEWAKARWPNRSLIDAAVALRHGRPAQLDAGGVDELLRHVETVLTAAAASEASMPS